MLTGSCKTPHQPLYYGSQRDSTMFSTTLTNPKAFGATYQWAILSVLPMDTDKTRHGLGPSEINKELGMPKEARTTMSLLLKELAAKGIVKRYSTVWSPQSLLQTDPTPQKAGTVLTVHLLGMIPHGAAMPLFFNFCNWQQVLPPSQHTGGNQEPSYYNS